jgi:hypothetical protein
MARQNVSWISQLLGIIHRQPIIALGMAKEKRSNKTARAFGYRQFDGAEKKLPLRAVANDRGCVRLPGAATEVRRSALRLPCFSGEVETLPPVRLRHLF